MLTKENLKKQKEFYSYENGYGKVRDLYTGFLPAFKDERSEETHLCVDLYGNISPCHTSVGLPPNWVAEWSEYIHYLPVKLIPTIVAGFMREGEFFYRNDIIESLQDD